MKKIWQRLLKRKAFPFYARYETPLLDAARNNKIEATKKILLATLEYHRNRYRKKLPLLLAWLHFYLCLWNRINKGKPTLKSHTARASKQNITIRRRRTSICGVGLVARNDAQYRPYTNKQSSFC